MNFKNRFALITTAAGVGIGRINARLMVREGSNIVITDLQIIFN